MIPAQFRLRGSHCCRLNARILNPFLAYGYDPSVSFRRPDDVERVGFQVARDLSLVDLGVIHHAYHQLYNDGSPWWGFPETLAITDLSEPSVIEWVEEG